MVFVYFRSPNQTISEIDFQDLLGLPEFYSKRLFFVFDKKGTGVIDWEEFATGLSIVTLKIKFIYCFF